MKRLSGSGVSFQTWVDGFWLCGVPAMIEIGMARASSSSAVHRLWQLTSGHWIGACRAIRTGQLHALPRFHIRPVNVMVFHGPRGELV
jgi:hypothetical protein